MGKYQPIYSDAQRRGIVRAVVDGDLSPSEAIRAASDGLIPHPDDPEQRIEPFAFNVGTLRAYVRDERRRRTGGKVPAWIAEGDADEVVERLARRTLALAAHEIDRQERAKTPDLVRLRGANTVLREARALIRGDGANRRGGPRAAKPEGTGDAVDAGRALMDRVKRVRAGEIPSMTDPEESETDEKAGARDAAETREQETGGGDGGGIPINGHEARASEAGGERSWTEAQAEAQRQASRRSEAEQTQ